MIMFLKRFAWVAVVVVAFLYGRHTGVEKSERSTLADEIEVRDAVEAKAVELREVDDELAIEQKQKVIIQHEEVIKYVTKYKTKIVSVPSVVECVDNSGLLELINTTTPTRDRVKASD